MHAMLLETKLPFERWSDIEMTLQANLGTSKSLAHACEILGCNEVFVVVVNMKNIEDDMESLNTLLQRMHREADDINQKRRLPSANT
uniref:AlNc14C752G12484 protein n=1 Tax=Albugo laibachii Nc14 TaxID=890382 RepID=F0X200_9STRA|nr:AlNc14C752G12484 [Albugo laibachii Nc14]|eukprot:CCA27859.1 AlNc14C752G12484 [Albugo laibachii Nc14]